MKNEPVVTAGGVAALITAIVGLTAAFNVWNPTQDQVTAILTIVGILVPLIAAFVARSKVSPV